GVGQSPALNLRLMNPTSSGLTPDSSPLNNGPTAPPPLPEPPGAVDGPFRPELPTGATGLTTAIASSSTSAATSNFSLAPNGLFLPVGNTPVARPSMEAAHVAAVGPSGQGKAVALASITTGLPPGIDVKPIRGDAPVLEPVPEAPADHGQPVEL